MAPHLPSVRRALRGSRPGSCRRSCVRSGWARCSCEHPGPLLFSPWTPGSQGWVTTGTRIPELPSPNDADNGHPDSSPLLFRRPAAPRPSLESHSPWRGRAAEAGTALAGCLLYTPPRHCCGNAQRKL